jgi:prepilin-type N-terminal cleavage/methylation domain-containing protein
MKNSQRGFTAIEFLVVIVFLATLSIGGVVIYTAFHFIGKFW